jgi:hypothetical protein
MFQKILRIKRILWINLKENYYASIYLGNKYIKMAGMLNNGTNNFNLRINLDNK